MRTKDPQEPRWKPTLKEMIIMSAAGILFFGQIIVCFLFYNWTGLSWLSYLGWMILVMGLVLGMVSRRTFEAKGGVPSKKEWQRTTVVVDTGIYGVVRHPMYLSFILIVVALMLISQHWLNIILGVPVIAFLYYTMIAEERINVSTFGDDYIQYMQRVPRMNFVRGIMQRQKGGIT